MRKATKVGQVTTVTFEDGGGEMPVAIHDINSSKTFSPGAIAPVGTSGISEAFEQLVELIGTPRRERGALRHAGLWQPSEIQVLAPTAAR